MIFKAVSGAALSSALSNFLTDLTAYFFLVTVLKNEEESDGTNKHRYVIVQQVRNRCYLRK